MGHEVCRRIHGPQAEPSCAGWYADPLAPEEAEAALAQAHAELRRAYLQSECAIGPRLRGMIARFWLDRPIALEYASLTGTAQGARERALVELVYGQLLMSRKLRGALDHLQAGFSLTAPWLAPADYFTLLKRHELLAYLPLAAHPAPPQALDALLTQAAVIRRLGARPPGRQRLADPCDTLG